MCSAPWYSIPAVIAGDDCRKLPVIIKYPIQYAVGGMFVKEVYTSSLAECQICALPNTLSRCREISYTFWKAL
jgi:hypothetical protein